MALLEVRGLCVDFATREGRLRAVDAVDFEAEAGRCTAVVGESGSGKSQLLLACLGLLAPNASVSGSIRFDGRELAGTAATGVRGTGIGMVFQDASASLTPHRRIGEQLAEVHMATTGGRRAAALAEAQRVLELVRLPDAAARLAQFPHELSGGMRQRVAIAAALIARPRLLFADEPTTALDVTVQAQIVALLGELCEALGMGLVLVTHDLGIVAGLADDVAVMYAGRVVERAPATALFDAAAHPYTAGLLAAVPQLGDPPGEPMRTIPGVPPAPGRLPSGCRFAPRCSRADARCQAEDPPLRTQRAGLAACHHPLQEGMAR